MAIKNIRKSITANASDDRLRSKLKEGYKRFLNEGDEDEEMSDDDMGLGDDLNLEDGAESEDMGGDEGMDDMDMDSEDGEMGATSPIDDLNDTESEQVNAWIDELLGDSLDQVEVEGAQSLDTEMPSADIDPMGEQNKVHEDMPMTVSDLESIIDSDDSLSALENELSSMAIDQDGEKGGDMLMDNEEDEMEGEDMNMDQDDDMMMDEAEDPMKGIDKYFDQGYEGEDRKDDLQEEVELAPDNKQMGMKNVPAGLNDKITSTVTAMPGSRTAESIEADQKGVVTEGVNTNQKLSKMLVKAAHIIEKYRKEITSKNKFMESLKLDNYKLIKANGLLSVAGETLSRDARTQISESFDKCKSIEQVNKFYNKITEKIKNAQRPSLNQTVGSKKTKINVIKESAGNKKEILSQEQMRKNMLMGLNTNEDVYFA